LRIPITVREKQLFEQRKSPRFDLFLSLFLRLFADGCRAKVSNFVIATFDLFLVEFKEEVGGEPFRIAANLLPQRDGFHLVKRRQIPVEEDLLAANEVDTAFDQGDRCALSGGHGVVAQEVVYSGTIVSGAGYQLNHMTDLEDKIITNAAKEGKSIEDYTAGVRERG